MKTAISVPDEAYERIEKVAKKYGMNRSQFYAKAADRYASELESSDFTAAIDVVIEATDGDESAQFAIEAARKTFSSVDDEW